MRKNKIIVFLLVSILCFSSVSVLFALTEEEELLFGIEDTVSAVSKKTESLSDVPMAVYVIDREELKRWGIRSLFEIFSRVPGYSFYNVDFHGQYGPISRGLYSVWRFGYSYELSPIFDWGHALLSPNFYKSIELARGPAGLAWGSAAEAGLINFNIRDDLDGQQFVVQHGEKGRRLYEFMYGKKFEKEGDGFFVGFHREAQNTEFVSAEDIFKTAGAKWGIHGVLDPTYQVLSKVKSGPFKLVVDFEDIKRISRTPWTSNPDAFENAIETLVGEGLSAQRMESLAYRLEYALPIKLLELKLYHNFAWKHFWVESVYLSAQKRWDWGLDGLAKVGEKLDINFGGDIQSVFYNDIPGFQSTWVRDLYSFNSKDKGTYRGQNLITGEKQRNFFTQGNYHINDKLKFVLGGRVDWKKDWQPNETAYSGPRSALIYTPLDNLTLKYLYNRTIRRPQGNERAGGKTKEELLVANELVSIYKISDKLEVDLTLYLQELEDIILRDSTSYNDFFNAGSIKSTGVEWAAKYKPIKQTLCYWNGYYAKNKSAKGTAVINDKAATAQIPSLSDNTPLFVPSLNSFLGVEVPVSTIFRANIDLRSIISIPYLDLNGVESKASANFIDITLRTKEFLNDRLRVSFVVANLFNSDKRLPAFGEHSQNKKGTLPVEGRLFYTEASYTF